MQDHFSGTVSVTNNGISLVPSFSLGDPAVIFDLKYRRGKFSIEPDIRFSLEAKPWSFIFWLRYNALESERFSLRIGAHPAYNFMSTTSIIDGVEKNIIVARRFFAGELAPNYRLSENFSVGLYYLYSYGPDTESKNIHFLVANGSLTNIDLIEKFYLNFSPQVYYLRQDDLDGFYAVAFLALSRTGFPLSLTSTLNKALDTEILPEDDFVWNLSLVYRFK